MKKMQHNSKRENIADLFFQKARAFPNKTALICGDRSIDYRTLSEYTQVVAHNIQEAKGAYVAVMMENSIDFAALLLASAWVGVILVPFAPKMPPSQLERLFRKSGVTFCIGGCGAYAHVKQIEAFRANSPLRKIEESDPDRDYIIVMTSGSTSEPKPIVLTQRIKCRRIDAACRVYGLGADDTILVATPMYHSLAQRGVLLGLTLGATVVLMVRFSPGAFLESIECHRVTFSFAVSSQLESIVEIVDRFRLDSIKAMVSSSYAMRPQIKRVLLRYFPIHECYGTSEIGCVSELLPQEESFFDSVGKPMAGVKIAIVAPNDQGIGEIAVDSPWRFKCYFQMPDTTRRSFEGSYFLTGDLGQIRDGYLYYMGRKKEMIKTGGISVYPIDIERVLLEVEGVQEVAVVGVEDSYFGEAVVAAYVGDAKIADIKGVAKAKLASYQQPLFYERLDSLPKNRLGKVEKFKLKARYKDLDLGRRLKNLL